ncbi:tetratricopeptide repeat protein [Pseudomonas sp. NPDC008258]|uniref:tetratricopeptide repeat protein n=1 Tax=Pseudomonas sp. NPDC008258 TaxID=3364418 RepID=UPI0036E9D043
MSIADRYGLVLSTSSQAAAERYQTGVDLMLAAWPGANEALEAALTADPSFALAHAARARLHAMRGQIEHAKGSIELSRQWVVKVGNERERSHVHVLSLAIGGQSAQALDCALAHVERWPTDVIIFSLPLGAFGLFAFSGRDDHDQARVTLCERHARHFSHDDWWFTGYRGWAHGENGNLVRARELTERSLQLRIKNANAFHAHVHVLHESGLHADITQAIDGWLPEYDRAGVLHGHIAWHAALGALAQGRHEQALSIYSNSVAPDVSAGVPLNIITDGASLLWRLSLGGIDHPRTLWTELAAYAQPYFQGAGFAFADLHMAILSAATGDRAAVEQRIAALDEQLLRGSLAAGRVAPELCRAMLAFAEGRYEACLRTLQGVANEVVRIGGSGAQREIVQQTLIESLRRTTEPAVHARA